MRRWLHILSLSVLLFPLSCGDKAPISREDMSRIYADLFLEDQWLDLHPEYRYPSDTLLAYAPVFEKYGYSPEEFSRSMEFYLRDPERYSRMLQESSKILHSRRDELNRTVSHRNWVRSTFSGIDREFTARQPKFFIPVLTADSAGVFMPDTLLWDRLFRSRYDTLTVYYPDKDTTSEAVAEAQDIYDEDLNEPVKPSPGKKGTSTGKKAVRNSIPKEKAVL